MSNIRKNFRRRVTDSDEPDPVADPVPTPKPKKKTLLSFQDDEEEEPQTLKPKRTTSSSSSKSISKFTKPVIKERNSSVQSGSLFRPSSGSYTKEALLELQKNTKTLGGPRKEPVIVLKGLIKPDNSEQLGKDNEDDELDQVKINEIRATREKIRKGEESVIYDKSRIEEIKAKRERMRTVGMAAPDYISLDSGSNHGEKEGLSDEEPEFRGRVGLIGETGKKGVFESFGNFEETVVEVDEEEEEDRIWEEEQYRKALGKRRDDVVESGSKKMFRYDGDSTGTAGTDLYQKVGSLGNAGSVGNVGIGGFSGSNVVSIAQQAETTFKALRENLLRLQESHSRILASLSLTDENMSASVLKVTALENSLSAAGEKFIFLQKLRDFVSVICDFLQYKAPYIEELEAEMQKLQEERAASVLERRSADNEDEMIEIEAAVKAATTIFSKSANTSTTTEMATKAAQTASRAAKEQHNLPVKLDELGRDLNLQKRMDITRRADARKRRKARSDAKRLASMDIDGPQQRIEGESSTDESDSETAAYESSKDMLFQTADQIFSDTADEYSQLSAVMERFESWKKDYPASYQDAYMSLSIPSIFSPYVRLELLKWDPLHKDKDFIDMKWHSVLYNYGIEDEDNINSDDADADLVPQLVEKVAVPILHHAVSQCWDLLSTRETTNVVAAMELVIGYLPASSEALVKLVSVLRDRIADGIANLTVPTWDPLVMKAVPNAGQVAAYRFGTSVRLLRNICMWNKVIALPVLETLAFDELLSGKILPHLLSIKSNVHDAVTRTERVVASLSEILSGQSVAAHRSPKLQPLVDYLLSLGRTLEKNHGSGGSESEIGGIPLRLIKMLVELNEYDHARTISKTFNLKVAL